MGKLVQIIQQESTRYQLQGDNKLRFQVASTTPEIRLSTVRNLLKMLN